MSNPNLKRECCRITHDSEVCVTELVPQHFLPEVLGTGKACKDVAKSRSVQLVHLRYVRTSALKTASSAFGIRQNQKFSKMFAEGRDECCWPRVAVLLSVMRARRRPELLKVSFTFGHIGSKAPQGFVPALGKFLVLPLLSAPGGLRL